MGMLEVENTKVKNLQEKKRVLFGVCQSENNFHEGETRGRGSLLLTRPFFGFSSSELSSLCQLFLFFNGAFLVAGALLAGAGWGYRLEERSGVLLCHAGEMQNCESLKSKHNII